MDNGEIYYYNNINKSILYENPLKLVSKVNKMLPLSDSRNDLNRVIRSIVGSPNEYSSEMKMLLKNLRSWINKYKILLDEDILYNHLEYPSYIDISNQSSGERISKVVSITIYLPTILIKYNNNNQILTLNIPTSSTPDMCIERIKSQLKKVDGYEIPKNMHFILKIRGFNEYLVYGDKHLTDYTNIMHYIVSNSTIELNLLPFEESIFNSINHRCSYDNTICMMGLTEAGVADPIVNLCSIMENENRNNKNRISLDKIPDGYPFRIKVNGIDNLPSNVNNNNNHIYVVIMLMYGGFVLNDYGKNPIILSTKINKKYIVEYSKSCHINSDWLNSSLELKCVPIGTRILIKVLNVEKDTLIAGTNVSYYEYNNEIQQGRKEYKLWLNNNEKDLNLINGVYNDPPNDNPPIITIEFPKFNENIYIPMPLVTNDVHIENEIISKPSKNEIECLLNICKLSI